MIFLHTFLIDRFAFALSFKFIKNHTEVVPTCVGVTFLYSQGIANLSAVKDVVRKISTRLRSLYVSHKHINKKKSFTKDPSPKFF